MHNLKNPKFFRHQSLGALIQSGAAQPILTLPGELIMLPALQHGAKLLPTLPFRQFPAGADWRAAFYPSFAPTIFTAANAILHSSAGIICIGDAVIEETLDMTTSQANHYVPDQNGIWLDLACMRPLPGRHLAALAGAEGNYFHALIDGLGRLAAVPDGTALDGILANGRYPKMAALLSLHPAHATTPRTLADPTTTLLIQNLVFTTSMHGMGDYHPCLDSFFYQVAQNAPPASVQLPSRFYIDRRNEAARRLVNETELIAALAKIGIAAIEPQNLSQTDQIALFSHATQIVGSHGSGLANLVFAPPTCQLLEIQLDAVAPWYFRHLAALKGLGYDCVMGTTIAPWPVDPSPAQRLEWHMPPDQVITALSAPATPHLAFATL